MFRTAIPALAASLITATAISAQQPAQPIAWGQLSQQSGCVIFAEGHKTSGRFYGVAITTKTVGKLTVIESQNYTFPDKEVLETQDSMNNLMLVSQKDHIKFVKIPEKYTPQLLDAARDVCKSGAAPQ